MKKIFTLLAALLVGGAVASAENVVFIGETGYESLEAALAAAVDNDVIEVKSDITISATVKLNSHIVTIKASDGVTISCRTKNKLAFQVDKTTTFNNLKLAYIEEDASNMPLIQASTAGTTLAMENCEVKDFKGTNPQGVMSVKSSGKVNLKNVTFTNNIVPENRGEIFIGNNGSIIDGTINASILPEKNLSIIAGESFNPTTPVKVYVDANRNPDSRIVEKCTDLTKFQLMSDKYVLKVKNNDLYVANKPVVYIGETGYDSLNAAVDAAQEGDVIKVAGDIEISDRIGLNKNITIEAVDGVNVTFKRTDKAAFLATNGGATTLKNLNLVYTNTNASGSKFLEANQGHMIVEDCVINDFNTTSNQGVVAGINGGKFTLKNVTFENCVVPQSDIFFGANGSTVDGTTNGSIYVEQKYTFTAGQNFDPAPKAEANATDAEAAPAANAVKLYLHNHGEGDNVVLGTEDASKFNLQHETLELAEKDGNLVLQKKTGTGIVGIEADGNAPVEYFNLNGVQVKADNMTPGVYVRRQGKNVTKVMVK